EQEVLGIFQIGSRINHSCSPNTTRYFTGVRFEFRAVRTIEIGEEVTITYIDAFRPCRERQAFLWKHWRFSCHCDAC
ncbi:SET domain-containing protein, partial [Calocera viscosa TUFC12733]